MESLYVNRNDLFGCDVSYFIPLIIIFCFLLLFLGSLQSMDLWPHLISWDELLDKILDHSYIGVCLCVC